MTLPDICGKVAYNTTEVGERYKQWVAENMNDVNFGATGFVCLKCSERETGECSGECEKVANTNGEALLRLCRDLYRNRNSIIHGEANKPNKKASEFEQQVSYVIDTAYSDTKLLSVVQSYSNKGLVYSKLVLNLGVLEYYICNRAHRYYENCTDEKRSRLDDMIAGEHPYFGVWMFDSSDIDTLCGVR